VTKTKPGKARTKPSRGDDDDDADRPSKAKKSGGGNVMMYVGIGLGVVAVIGLVVVGIIIFGGGSNNNSSGSSSSSSSNTKTNQPNPAPKPADTSNTNAGNAAANAGGNTDPGDTSGQVNITNLLPNDTQSVTSVLVNKLAGSTLGGAMFSSSSGFRPEMVNDGLGLPMQSMSRYIRAESIKNGWAFNVIQMFPSYNININDLKTKLGGQKGPHSPLKKYEYFYVSSNDLLDALAHVEPGALLGQKTEAQAKKQAADHKLVWHLYDAQTLVMADIDQMEQFLQADRQQPQITKSTAGGGGGPNMMPGGRGASPFQPPGSGGVPTPLTPAPGGGGPGPAAGGGGPQVPGGKPGSGGPDMRPPNMPGGGPNMPPGGPGGSGMPGGGMFSEKNTYMTVREDLKAMLDRIEDAKQVIFSSAAIDLEDLNARAINNIRGISGLGAIPALPAIITAGAALHTFSENRLTGVIAFELKREDDARQMSEALQRFQPVVAKLVGNWMGITIDANTGNTPGTPGMMQPGTMPPGTFPPGNMPPGTFPPGGGRPGSMPPGAMQPGSIPPGSPGPGMMPPGAGSNPRGPGGFPGPTPDTPAGNEPNPNQPNPSTIRVANAGKTVFINVDVEVTEATDQKFRNIIEGQVVKLKGMLDVQAMTQPRWHELAGTAISLKAQKKPLIGTYRMSSEAQVAFGGSSFISSPPSQRVGFMIDLLPFLGKEDIYQQIDPKQSWRSEKNLRPASNWIPQFINPSYPRASWQATLPSLPGRDLGATHFVGLSGIGLDAAEYMPGDPATAKKLGMVGYNRETRFTDIKDGLSNTIYMIQVPPTLQRPWIAGGGATIQGMPEKNSIAPFVYLQANGKRGTYALMADGSVRFIADTIPDKTFQAMVTIAGEDDVSEMNAHSQVVPVGQPANASTAPPPAKTPGK
jgi:hypothetical protein